MGQLEDLELFREVARRGALSRAARELGYSTAAVSRRLTALETRLGARLVERSTRRLALTAEGKLLLSRADEAIKAFAAVRDAFSGAEHQVRGAITVSASWGFGRAHVAPAIALLKRRHADLAVHLRLTDNAPAAQSFDVAVRLGQPPLGLKARRLAGNFRVLVAAPTYFAQRRPPRTLRDLRSHAAIFLHEDDATFGRWLLRPVDGGKRGFESVDVPVVLSANDGESVRAWALAGLGIALRSMWDVSADLKAGRLVRVLPSYRAPDSDVFAVYADGRERLARVRAFVDALEGALDGGRRWNDV